MRRTTLGLLAAAYLGCVFTLGCKKEDNTGASTVAPGADTRPGIKASHKTTLVPPPPPPPPPGK
ncbi:MAG: hypothetical protein ACJ8FY_03400 [Gemmataceae bacterium]